MIRPAEICPGTFVKRIENYCCEIRLASRTRTSFSFRPLSFLSLSLSRLNLLWNCLHEIRVYIKYERNIGCERYRKSMCIFAKGAGNTPRLIFTIQRDICETSKTRISCSFGSERGWRFKLQTGSICGISMYKGEVLTLIARALLMCCEKKAGFSPRFAQRERKSRYLCASFRSSVFSGY
jgi:hypothetical protein